MSEFVGYEIPVVPRVAEFSASVWGTLLAMSLLLGWVLWWCVGQASHDRTLRRVVLGSFGLRVLLGLAMYLISYWEWPLFTSLQRQDGFWVFGFDAYPHHYFGARFVEAWKQGIELPDPGVGVDYYAVIATIYWLLGAHPLYPITLNGWLAACCGLLAYVIGRRLFDERTAKLGACLVAFWPSSFIWSSQLLKDALSWFVVFASLALSLEVVTSEAQGRSLRLRQRVWRFVWLGLAVMVMSRIRRYVGIALAVAAVVIFLPMALRALWQKRIGGATTYVMVTGIIVSAMVIGRAINPLTMLSPRHPEVGRFRLGMQARSRGDLQRAERELQRALELNASYGDAYFTLGAVKLEQGQPAEALRASLSYFERKYPKQWLQLKPILADVYAGQGEAAAAQGWLPEAVAAYERAVALDPGSIRHLINLVPVVERQQPGSHRVLSLLEKALTLRPGEADRAQIGRQLAHYYAAQGEAEATEGRLSEAVAAYERAVAFDPGSLTHRVEMARVILRLEPGGNRWLAVLEEALAIGSHAGTGQRQEAAAEVPVFVQPPTLVSQPTTPTRFSPNVLEVPVPLVAPQRISSTTTVDGHPTGTVSSVPLAPESMEHFHHVTIGNRGGIVGHLTRTFQRFRGHVQRIMAEVTVESLTNKRAGFIGAGGYFVADPAFPPVAIGLFAPFPWEWFDVRGSTGIMRLFGGLEMLLWYALFPAVCWGSLGILRRRRSEELFLLTFIMLLLISMSWVVINIGTLFRLRLSFLLPLLLIGAAGQPIGVYRRMVQRLWQVRVASRRAVVEPAADATIPNGVPNGVEATVR